MVELRIEHSAWRIAKKRERIEQTRKEKEAQFISGFFGSW
jgi:hypothetical protein